MHAQTAQGQRIILGSSSVPRKKEMQTAGWEFSILVPKFDEKSIRNSDPVKLTTQLAKSKADDIIMYRLPKGFSSKGAFLITSDKVIFIGNKILEKPKSSGELRAFIRAYNEHNPVVVTAVHVRNLETGQYRTSHKKTILVFDTFTDEDINTIIDSGHWRIHAGGIVMGEKPFSDRLIDMVGHKDVAEGLCLHAAKKQLRQVGYLGILP